MLFKFTNYTNVKAETKALIIDDEAEICYLLSRILRNLHFEVYCATSLYEARIGLETFDPSLIFIDNHLPDGLGVQFVEYIRTGYPKAKIVIITGQEIESKDKITRNPPPVVYKPFTSEHIYNVIEAIS
jgi:two-component SAPR family response regulator